MPQTITIGVFILGAILVLIGILGGNFKLFGAEVATTISNPLLRFVAFILGIIFLIIGIADNSDDNGRIHSPNPSITPSIPTIPTIPSPQPAMGAYCCDLSGIRRCPLIKPLPVGESCFCPYQGLGYTCQ
jgi:hypothetical protein